MLSKCLPVQSVIERWLIWPLSSIMLVVLRMEGVNRRIYTLRPPGSVRSAWRVAGVARPLIFHRYDFSVI